ncbi:MAG: hypothetical protein QXY62_05870 [Candidatus Altiarchaeota archaeon]
MKIGKWIATGKVWKRIELTDEELNNAMSELLKFNLNELKRTINEVINEIKKTGLPIKPEEAIRILFEKQGIASYTFLNNILEEKIQLIKTKEIEERKNFPSLNNKGSHYE